MFHASRLFAIARRVATFSRASVMYHSVMFSSTPSGTEEESVCHVRVVFILGYKETMPFLIFHHGMFLGTSGGWVVLRHFAYPCCSLRHGKFIPILLKNLYNKHNVFHLEHFLYDESGAIHVVLAFLAKEDGMIR